MNRRLIAILLALSLILCLFGCGNTQQPSIEAPSTDPVESTEDTTAGTEEHQGGAKPLDDTTIATETPVTDNQTETQEQPTQGTAEQPSQNTEPTEPESSEETKAPTEPTEPNVATGATAYEQYYNMSGEEQKAFIASFGSIEAFFVWHTAAKAEYEKLHPDIEIDGGSVDLGGGSQP